MFGLFLTRAILMAIPFAAYFAWRKYAQRTGRDLPAVPWGVLLAAGLVLVGLSLMATVAFQGDNRGYNYVPAEAQPDGQVRPGGFDPTPARPPPAPTAPNIGP